MSDLEERLDQLARWAADSHALVAFTGAGISTDSGIPDFRGPDGVWTRRDAGLPPPAWKVRPDQVRPNAGHAALVALQNAGKLLFLISQNVDNLHLESGIEPERIAELHGNGKRLKCLACDRRFAKAEVGWDDGMHGRGYRTQRPVEGQPGCPCGGRLISTVVNFGDPMPEREMARALSATQQCDLFVVIGSSLAVTPAADFPVHALDAGARLVIMNRDPTPLDARAHLTFHEGIGDVLPVVVERALRA